MSGRDTERIARRLGLTDAVICRLQAAGHLERLAVAPGELDARMYRAQLAHLGAVHRRSGPERADG